MTQLINTIHTFLFNLIDALLLLGLPFTFFLIATVIADRQSAAPPAVPPVDTEDWPPEIKEYDRIHGHLPPREEVIAACIRNHHWDDL